MVISGTVKQCLQLIPMLRFVLEVIILRTFLFMIIHDVSTKIIVSKQESMLLFCFLRPK